MESRELPYDVMIVGGGISGCSFAFFCAEKKLKTVLLEKNRRCGGIFNTPKLERGFWQELGAHTFYNSYVNTIEMIEALNLKSRMQKRQKVSFKLYKNGKIRPIISSLDFLDLFKSLPSLFTTKKAGLNVKQYYSKVLGHKNFDNLFAPAFNAVISQDASNFPADFLFKKRRKNKNIFKSFTLDQGVQTVIDAIAGRPEINLQTQCDIVAIDRIGPNFRITLKSGEVFIGKNLVLATTSTEAASLLKNVAPKVRALLQTLPNNKIDSIAVCLPRQKTDLNLMAGLIPIGQSFYSMVSRDVVPHEHFRGFTFHFPESKSQSDYETRLRLIAQVLNVPQEAFFAVNCTTHQLPAVTLQHQEELVHPLDGLLCNQNIYITGNFFSGLAIEDCVIRSKSEFSRMVTPKKDSFP